MRKNSADHSTFLMRKTILSLVVTTALTILVGCQTNSDQTDNSFGPAPVASSTSSSNTTGSGGVPATPNSLAILVELPTGANGCQWRFEPNIGKPKMWQPFGQMPEIYVGPNQERHPIAIVCQDPKYFPTRHVFTPRETGDSMKATLFASPMLIAMGAQNSPLVYMDYKTPFRVGLLAKEFPTAADRDKAFDEYKKELAEQEGYALMQIEGSSNSTDQENHDQLQTIQYKFEQENKRIEKHRQESQIKS